MDRERSLAPRNAAAAGLTIALLITALAIGCQPNKSSSPTAAGSGASTTASPETNNAISNVDSSVSPSATPPVADSQPASTSPAGGEDTAKAQTASADEPGDGQHGAEGEHEREPLFVGWSTPQVALFITGQQGGYLEPCGCTGLSNQKGGLARRYTLHRELTSRGWPLVAVDAGNQIRRFGRQGEIKFQVSSEALKQIGYQAVALGVDDLRLSSGELAAVTFAADGATTPFVSANAAVLDRSLTPTHHIVEAGGKKIGITAILGKGLQSQIVSSEIVLSSPEEGLDAVMPQLREAKCDLLVLLAHASTEESQQLAQKYTDFHVVVSTGRTGEPAWQPQPIPGTKAILVDVGTKGMFVGVLGVFDDPQNPLRYQRVPLDARFADAPEMIRLLADYQQQLQSAGFEGLGLNPLPHPSGYKFVGSEKCGECHTTAYAVWESSRHAHATDSIVHPPERGEVARHFDPECISCHVTGWEPQRYFPYVSGYLSLDETPLMKGSGCENCHGPGSAHVAAQEGDATEEEQKRLQAAMRLKLSDARRKCEECHDIDNSPDFHATGAFQKYWQQVRHKGVD